MRVEIPDDRPLVEIPLREGGAVILVPLAPDDRHYLVEGLAELSIDSRFSRFGQGRDRLSDSEWDYLSDVDQRRHVAWAAVIDGFGVGVGRYIVVDDGSAEVAVTVLDHYQGKGVGSALLQALVAVARSDGIRQFRFEVVPSNARVREALRTLEAEVSESDGLIAGRLTLDDLLPVSQEAELVEAMRQFREMG